MALRSFEGVLGAGVSHERGEAVVTFDESKTDLARLRKAIELLGYTAAEA